MADTLTRISSSQILGAPGGPSQGSLFLVMTDGTLKQVKLGAFGLTVDASGAVTLDPVIPPPPNFADNEQPDLPPPVDGAIVGPVPITLVNTPTGGSEHVHRNGLRLRPGADYTIAGAVITLAVFNSGDTISVDYRF